MDEARRWISGLGPELAVQARLLERLLGAVEADQRWEWLELGCSVAEGRGDAWSDLDVGLGYRDEPDRPAGDEVTAMLRGLGETVEVSVQPAERTCRWWVQYADGGQIDLVAMAADSRPGRAPGSVALLDRQGRLREAFTPRVWTASAEDVRGWLLDGWEALANVAKYVHRGSLLEAIDQVHRARGRVLQLWAAGEEVAYPAFGLTSLLDDARAALPPDIGSTYPVADRTSVVSAALATARLLHRAGLHARPDMDTPLRRYVEQRLAGMNRTTGTDSAPTLGK